MEMTMTNEQTKQRPFLMLYHDLLDSELLENPYEKLLCIYLKKHCNSENTCFPSLQTLAKETKISVSKIKTTMKELIKKGIVIKKNRTRKDGGKSSNLYTLNDCKELWSKKETKKEIITDTNNKPISLAEIPLEELEKEIHRRKNELASSIPTTAPEETSPFRNMSNNSSEKNYKTDKYKSQDKNNLTEKYSMDWVKCHYDYKQLMQSYPEEKQSIDKVMSILYEDLNTSKHTIRVNRENKPTEIYISKITKLTSNGIIYSIKKYKENTRFIPKPVNYIRTLLYNAEEQMHFETINQQNQGESLPLEQQNSKNNEPEKQILGMTKSARQYNSYSQRHYSQEELDELESKLLQLAIQPTEE